MKNEEITRRCRVVVVDIAEEVEKGRLRWCGHVRRNEGELVRNIME
jgi:hypothetical protein